MCPLAPSVRLRMVLTAAALMAALLDRSTTVKAQTPLPSASPRISMRVNGSASLQGYQGSPLVVEATVYHSNRFSRKTLITPLEVNAMNGSWANAIRLAVVNNNGESQNWPLQLIGAPSGSLRLDDTNVGKLSWVVSPEATATIPPGIYTAIAALDTTSSAGNNGWNGVASSYPVTIQMSAPLLSPSTGQQEEQISLLADYDHLLGDDARAVSDLDTFLVQNPHAVGALTVKGNLLEQMGQATAALNAYDSALAAHYAAHVNDSEEPNAILIPLGLLRSKLLSQTGQRGVPQVSIEIANQGIQAPGVAFLDLQFTNVGNDVAGNIVLNSLNFQIQSTAGEVFFNNLLSAHLPISVGFLSVGSSATVRIFLSTHGTVGSFTITETGTASDIFGAPAAFTQTQTVSGNFTGGGSPSSLTITARNASQQYGQAIPSLNSVTYNGFVNGDTAASLSGALSCSTTATQSSPAGSYPITCSGLTSPNYKITYLPGTFTITPVSLVVAARNATSQYGQPIALNGASESGFVNGDTTASLGGTLNCATPATQSSPVSSYPISCSGLTSQNYAITYVTGTLAVTPAPLVVTARNVTVPFGQAIVLNGATESGFVNGDSVASLRGTLNCTTSASQGSPSGNYPISCSGLSATNYTISFVQGTLTIGPALIGDVNKDGIVNCSDVAIVKASFGKKKGDAGFDARADMNADSIVNIIDLSTVTKQLPAGTVCK